tara:strand:- start:2542 stop:2841 length:300 start_codon:yes stop_codon:yes gene_type:complete
VLPATTANTRRRRKENRRPDLGNLSVQRRNPNRESNVTKNEAIQLAAAALRAAAEILELSNEEDTPDPDLARPRAAMAYASTAQAMIAYANSDHQEGGS